MQVFKNKWFARFARQTGIGDRDLCEVIERAERGLIDADLGGSVMKQRIARPNEGRSGGFRSIIVFRQDERAFFVFGFAKSGRDNITADELTEFRALAQQYLRLTAAQIQAAIEAEKIIEVRCDAQNL